MDNFDNDRPYDFDAPDFDAQDEAAGDSSFTPASAPAPASAEPSYRPAYVRPAKPRRTVEAIDDDDQDAFDARGNYTHDSNFTVSGQRRIRQSDRLQRDSQYGQYLQVPKGKKSIFSSRQQAKQRRSAIVMVVIVAVLVVLLIFAVRLIASAA